MLVAYEDDAEYELVLSGTVDVEEEFVYGCTVDDEYELVYGCLLVLYVDNGDGAIDNVVGEEIEDGAK
jgi:hypothetical protein